MATSAEARQPMQLAMSATYFASPIQTLSESIKDPGQDWITSHDLVEAYNVLSARIRSHRHDILIVDKPLPSLAIFKAQSSQIAECISRDLERLLPSPFDSPQHAGRSYYSDHSLSADERHIANNNATLCHHALRFMTDIFTFRSLYSNFTNDQLSALLHDALFLCKIREVPLLNPGKIYAMVIWALKVQQLPLQVLIRQKRIITSTLQNMVTLELAGDIIKLDAFKAIHCILKQHPIFVDDFLVLLPLVLDHLTCGSLAIRCNAAMALSGFTLAKLHYPTISSYLRGRIFELVQTYIDGQTSRRNSLGADIRLPAVFQAAMAGEPFWEGKGPSFAVSITSCLIVLLDYSFYSSPRALKFVFSVFARCSCHRQKFIRVFHPHMWELAIWAFSRIPIAVTDEHDQTEISTFLDIRDRAYLTLRQDLRHGVGTTLVTTLLNTGESEEDREGTTNDVQKALECAAALVNSEKVSEIREGYSILCRFMSNVGVASSLLRNNNLGSPIAPSPVLIDGSLLGSDVGSIAIPPRASSIEQVRPLSETEASIYWEELSKIWVSLVHQFLLGSMPELSPDLIHIWQGLLLVQAQLTQEHLHLTSSLSFAAIVASIIAKISTPLEQADAQARYLFFIGKVWGVMKNVFKTSWLCSPAEIILAALLKKQFSLSDGQVKDLWSQLCADLVAVGIPTVLHVLHVRSESQEGTEVTRELWLILANNGPLTTSEEDWMSLLCFLVMPFGVWVMSSTEIEMWDSVFDTAIAVASRTALTKDIVVSHFLKLLGEVKLVSLKQTPALLKTLLRASCAEDSKLNTDLLACVDAVLISSYCHSKEQVELGLDLLHFLGGLISMMAESEFVQLLSFLQASMILWIVDEDNLLSDNEHRDLIIAIYCSSLDKLALLEPSITILNAIAPFIQSVFVRVRGHGPLAFHTFWRATYHTRLDIPQKDYPLLIQTCLKAWADFCEDSLADGISLDSLSLSEETPSTVPDSQSGELTSFKVGNSTFDLFEQLDRNDADIVNMEIDHTLDDSGTHGSMTPVQRSRRQSPLDHSRGVSRLNTDLLEGSFNPALQDPNHSRTPERYHSSDAVTPGVKRAVDLDIRSTKRRKTDPETLLEFRAGKGRSSESDLYIPPSQQRVSKLSASEPVTRTSSPLFAHIHSRSRRSEKNRQASSPCPEHKSASGSSSNDSDHVLKELLVPEPVMIVDDYDSWEQGMSAEDLNQVHKQEGSQKHSDSQNVLDTGLAENNAIGSQHSDDECLLSPSLGGEYPLRSKLRKRSQTAPQLINESSHPTYPQPLRRNQTSPLQNKVSSAQLDALQHAYAVITDIGTSQVDVQDIMQAKRLAHQISQVLDEQMCAKFGAQSDIQGGIG